MGSRRRERVAVGGLSSSLEEAPGESTGEDEELPVGEEGMVVVFSRWGVRVVIVEAAP